MLMWNEVLKSYGWTEEPVKCLCLRKHTHCKEYGGCSEGSMLSWGRTITKTLETTDVYVLYSALEATILRLKLRYFGQVMRTKGSLERDIMLGQVEGYRRQGRPWLHWIDSIKEITGLRLETLKETVKDRKKWPMLVEEKTRNRERRDVKWPQEKAMANHSWTS